MSTPGGKGSAPRPIPNPEKFSENWDRIFGNKDDSQKEPPADEMRARFEAWWDSEEGVYNAGPWQHDTPIQYAWAAWRAALATATGDGHV